MTEVARNIEIVEKLERAYNKRDNDQFARASRPTSLPTRRAPRWCPRALRAQSPRTKALQLLLEQTRRSSRSSTTGTALSRTFA